VDDIRTLLKDWFNSPAPTMQLLARPDWLLDGWSRICALWSAATSAEDAVSEMAALVPIIPREAEMWSSYRVGHLIDVPQYRRTVVRQLEDWRTGVTVTDLIARNECLLEKAPFQISPMTIWPPFWHLGGRYGHMRPMRSRVQSHHRNGAPRLG
jgi:hypothetical protein